MQIAEVLFQFLITRRPLNNLINYTNVYLTAVCTALMYMQWSADVQLSEGGLHIDSTIELLN
jgi:hypothetical protein